MSTGTLYEQKYWKWQKFAALKYSLTSLSGLARTIKTRNICASWVRRTAALTLRRSPRQRPSDTINNSWEVSANMALPRWSWFLASTMCAVIDSSSYISNSIRCLHNGHINKKLSCRREVARCFVWLNISPSSTVTMVLYCMNSEIKRDIGRKSIFHTPCIWHPSQEGFCTNIAIRFGNGKTRMVWLSNGENGLTTSLAVLTQYHHVTHG